MRVFQPLVLAVGALAITTATYVQTTSDRGLKFPELDAKPSSRRFDRLQSAALFVGVRRFDHDAVTDVPYAADDAVDLAYVFTLDRRASLVPPRRVILALSGQPQKEESRRRLAQLKNAGALVESATSPDILRLLEQQARAVGEDGILLFSLATHGFIDQKESESYVLGSGSSFEHTETALRLDKLIDTAARAKRSLLFIDACRERLALGTRSAGPDPRTAAPALANRMGKVRGQVVFYAAPAGGYAYDDEHRKNGVFSRAVIDGLSCEATAVRGMITVETLHQYVETKVLQWLTRNKEPARAAAIQVSMDGRTDNMPLAVCECPPCSRLGPSDVAIEGSRLTALGDDGKPIWSRDLDETVTKATVADLDADGAREVVVQVGEKIVTLAADGNPSWERGTSIRKFLTGVLRRYKEEIVAQSGENELSILDAAGEVMWSFELPETIKDFQINRPSARSDWRVVAASANHLSIFNANSGKRVDRKLPGPVESLHFVDRDGDGKLEIALQTASGTTDYYDFSAKPLN